jgi:probable rRNA maturation factor
MEAAGVGRSELSLALVGDEEIHALNRDYAGEDKPTDVLSFSQREGEGPALPGDAPALLGDIVISVETAARQARARGAALDEELLHLAVHGLAHLCGYDHATPDEERVMFGWEARLRAQALSTAKVKRVPRP